MGPHSSLFANLCLSSDCVQMRMLPPELSLRRPWSEEGPGKGRPEWSGTDANDLRNGKTELKEAHGLAARRCGAQDVMIPSNLDIL